ncbi:MAG: hypothetical protein F4Y21_10620, partial [Gemmatimonadetes bacterium]|nr:hypothetical protein [Gemmatimonadota bacterium]
RAFARDGTFTRQQGIGRGIFGSVIEQFGDAGVGAMRAVKAALDPEGIMNPGKVVEDRGSSP